MALKETFDASSISSFAREFRVLSGLEHANLPRYIDMFEAQGQWVFGDGVCGGAEFAGNFGREDGVVARIAGVGVCLAAL